MAQARQMASRPKLLRSPVPEDELDEPTPDDDQTIDADELAAARRARDARRPTSTTSSRTSTRAPRVRETKAPAKRQTGTRTKRSPSPARRPMSAAAAPSVHDGSGVLLGMFAYALFLAYARGGWAGVRKWIAAKFINSAGTPTGGGSSPTVGVPIPGGKVQVGPGVVDVSGPIGDTLGNVASHIPGFGGGTPWPYGP